MDKRWWLVRERLMGLEREVFRVWFCRYEYARMGLTTA